MKVLVAGAGAVGLMLGAMLARRGHRLTLVTRERHLTAIRRNGVTLLTAVSDESFYPDAVVTDPAHLPPEDYDLVLITTKAFDTADMAEQIRHHLGKKTIICSVQNGLGNLEAIRHRVGPGRPILGCVALFGCEVTEPATVRLVSQGAELKVGDFGEAHPMAVALVADAFAACGLTTHVSREIRKDLWAKFMMNAMTNALCAIKEKTLAELFESELACLTMERLVEEIFAVAEIAGVTLPWTEPNEFQEEYRRTVLPRFAHHRPSMSQDLARGGKTEISALNGYLVALGAAHGVPVPANAFVTELMQKTEALSRHAKNWIPRPAQKGVAHARL